jgi:hypothetical protein
MDSQFAWALFQTMQFNAAPSRSMLFHAFVWMIVHCCKSTGASSFAVVACHCWLLLHAAAACRCHLLPSKFSSAYIQKLEPWRPTIARAVAVDHGPPCLHAAPCLHLLAWLIVAVACHCCCRWGLPLPLPRDYYHHDMVDCVTMNSTGCRCSLLMKVAVRSCTACAPRSMLCGGCRIADLLIRFLVD